MKHIKTVNDLVSACQGKTLMMQSMKDMHSKLDARCPDNMPHLFLMQVEATETKVMSFYAGSNWQSYSTNLARGVFTSKIDTSRALAMLHFNLKRGNRTSIVDSYIEQAERDTLVELITGMSAERSAAGKILKEHDISYRYEGRAYKVPESVVCHNHGYPYDMISYKLDNKRVTFDQRYGDSPKINDESTYFNPGGFLESSNYFNSYNREWNVYKPGVRQLRQVHAHLQKTVELATEARKLTRKWLDRQEIKPR